MYLIKTIVILLNVIYLYSHPVAFFHGIADSCKSTKMSDLIDYLKQKLQTEVKFFEIGNGFMSSFFMKFKDQAELGCVLIKNDPLFQSDFSIIGISQGALISRYIIQNCDIKGKIKNFVSMSAPHMGSGSIPWMNCGWACNMVNNMMFKVIYFNFVQNHLSPAGYFKDKNNLENYKEYSTFLSDLNNEKANKTLKYKERFSKIEKLTLIMNEKDSVIFPSSSAWFEFYEEKSDKVIPLKESKFYKEDYIGLKQLDEEGKVNYLKFEGDHTQYSDYEIDNYIIPNLK